MAGIKIGDALLELGIDKGNFNRDMKGIGASIKKHQRAIGVGMAAVGTAIVGMATASVVSFAKIGDEVAKMAKRTGFSTEALSELRHAANLSGASLQGLEKASRTLAGAILDAGFGLETYVRVFAQLGLTYEQLAVLKPEDQFLKVLGALAEVTNESERAALATDLFGRAGTQLLPMLADGTMGLAEMRAEAHELGIVFSAEAAKSAEEITDALSQLKSGLQGVAFAIAESLLPIIEPLIDRTTEVVKEMGGWAKENETLVKVITGAGGLLIGLGGLLLILPKLQVAIVALGHTLKTLLLNPIVALIAALALLGFGINALVKHHTDWNKIVEASVEVNEALEESEGKLTEKVIEASRAYVELREAYGQLEPEEEAQLERTKAVIALFDEGQLVVNEATGALELYKEEVASSTQETEELIDATDRLSDSLRSGIADAFLAYGALSGKRVLTPFEFEQQKALGGVLGIPGLGLASGGIVTKPTMAMLGENGPEAVIPLGQGGGFGSANIILQMDGRTFARVMGIHLVEEIRLRTGVKL